MNDNKRQWQPIKGVLLVFLLLGSLGIGFFLWKYDDVFPAASVDFKLSKDEIAKRSREFCQSMGYNPEGSVEATTFQDRGEVATFLEHEYSMKEANALMHDFICVYYWYTRFCRTHAQEEFGVSLSTDGKLIYFNHEIEKERVMPTLSHEKAMEVALDFIKSKVGIDMLAAGQPTSSSSATVPASNGSATVPASMNGSATVPTSAISLATAPTSANSSAAISSSSTPSSASSVAAASASGSAAVSKSTADAASAHNSSTALASATSSAPVAADNATSHAAPKLLDGIKLIKEGTTKQLHRTDHYFTWEDQAHEYKGGHLRTSVVISGNQVTGFDRDLHIPEEYERRYANMRSYNDLLKQISSVLFAVVAAAMFFAFAWALSTKRIRWKLAFIAAAVSLVIEFLDFWNNWSGIMQSYSTADSLQGYLMSRLVSSLLTAGAASLSAIILVGGIEAVYRAKFPNKIAGEHLLNWKMLSNRTLLESIIAGIFVFGIHLGYVAVYYLAGQNLGMWSPLEVRDIGTIGSISPAFSSFVVGVNASTSEELLYRVLCFVLAQRLFKNFWIANFVQAAGWAFMHSDYPQEPPYARGLELTIVGLFYGYMFKRFGVLTGIISHFIYDAFLGVTTLFLTHSPFLAFTGLLACSPPFIALGIGLARRSKGEDVPDEVLLNENLVQTPPPAPPDPLHEEKHLEYTALSARSKGIMLLLCVVSALLCVFVHPRSLGGWGKITVPQAEIEQIAANFLKERGVTELGWKVGSALSENGDDSEAQYAFETIGFKKTEELIRHARVPLVWRVRFYKPMQEREYNVTVGSDGRPLALRVSEEEEAPGKIIDQDTAHKLTADYLAKYRPEFAPLQFETAEEEKHKNRSDFTVSYVVPRMSMGDARLKIDVDTVGGLVSFPHVNWDIPDSWFYERKLLTLQDQIAKVISQVVVVIMAAFGIIWTVGVFRAQAIHWRPVLIFAGLAGLFTVASQANEFVASLMLYNTKVQYLSFLTALGVNNITAMIFYSAIAAAMFAVGHGAFRLICPGVSGLSLWHSTLKPPVERRMEARTLWADGAWAAYTWVFVAAGLSVVSSYLEGRFSPEIVVKSAGTVVGLTQYSSASIEQIMAAITGGVMVLLMAPIGVGAYLKYFRSFKKYMAFSAITIELVDSATKYWQDYLREVGVHCVEAALLYFWIKYCARNNPVAYFLAGALGAVVGSISNIYKYSTIFTTELFVLSAITLMPLVIPFLFRRAKVPKTIVS